MQSYTTRIGSDGLDKTSWLPFLSKHRQ